MTDALDIDKLPPSVRSWLKRLEPDELERLKSWTQQRAARVERRNGRRRKVSAREWRQFTEQALDKMVASGDFAAYQAIGFQVVADQAATRRRR